MPPYSRKVMEHFKNHCNMGGIENSDGAAHVGNTVCGGIIEFYLEIKDGLIIRAHLESKHRLSV